jgi:hypothetical protein
VVPVSVWTLDLASGFSAYTTENGGEYTAANGVPFGISGVVYVSDNFGMGIYGNFVYLPQIAGTNPSRLALAEAITGTMLKNGGDNFLFGFDCLMGAAFMLYDSEKFKVPLTIGPHIYSFSVFSQVIRPKSPIIWYPDDEKLEYSEANFGLGFNISLEWYFIKRVYFLGRVQGSFDFINYTSKIKTNMRPGKAAIVTEDRDIGFNRAWGLMPQLGIGIRF